MRVADTLVALAALASQADALSWRQADAVKACLEKANLDFVDSSSQSWKKAIAPHNLRVPVTPRALVYASKVEHVQAAVRCGVQNSLKVAAKTGGHSYASMGLGGADGSLVIQLDRLYGTTLRSDNVAVVKGGTRLGKVALDLYNNGKRAFAHGTCPSVGSGGHVVHGGFGFSSHTHGLALDALVGVTVVLADGSVVHASKTENSDLFWAMRGAGSAFGIVVEFEFETFAVPDKVTTFKINSGLCSQSRANATTGFLAFQKVLEDGGLDPKINMRYSFGGGGCQVEGVYHGNKDDGRKAFDVLSTPLALQWTTQGTSITEQTWLQMASTWAYGETLDITYPYNGNQNLYASSLATKSISKDAMASFVNYYFDTAKSFNGPWWLQMDVHGDPNSRVAAVANDATSYAHRDKLWLFQFAAPGFGSGSSPAGITFVQGFMSSLTDKLAADAWGRYVNYIDTQLDRATAVKQYWGVNLARLQKLKAKFDPKNVLSNPQSIDPVA